MYCNLILLSDIDLTLQSLDNVISFYSVSQEVDDVIRKGPGLLNEGANLDVFLNALNRLAKANVYFLKNNPESVEIENVVSFFEVFFLSCSRKKYSRRHYSTREEILYTENLKIYYQNIQNQCCLLLY